MDEIKNKCLPATILCIGGSDSQNNNLLLLVACGNCSVVLQKTPRNTPNLHNGAYWYYTPDISDSKSMGFAPTATIFQNNPDGYDKYVNNQRLSWFLGGNYGGARLGSLDDLYNDSRYYKVILKKDF